MPPLKPEQLRVMRDELDRLYLNFVFIDGRASRLVERMLSHCSIGTIISGDEHARTFLAAYAFWKTAAQSGSFYADYVAKAVHTLDPRWSQSWANYAALLKLEPDGFHHAPALTHTERDSLRRIYWLLLHWY